MCGYMKDWLLKKLFKNFGRVDQIIRSGQPGVIKLRIMYALFGFKSVINLAWAPGQDKDDNKEMSFCFKRHIRYLGFPFGAGGPYPYTQAALEIIDLIDTLPRPVWIHCEGGKDRTDGIVMRWMFRKYYPREKVFEQVRQLKVPAEGWLIWAMEELDEFTP